MTLSAHVDLFQKPGPEAALNYLWERLYAHDLTQEEALALLSAVHLKLGASRAADHSLYASYSRFMGTLGCQMPVIHDYVISRWSEDRHAARRARAQADDPLADAPQDAPVDDSPIAALKLLETMPHTAIAPGGGAEGPGEPAEQDEQESHGGVPRSLRPMEQEQEPEEEGTPGGEPEEDAQDELRDPEADEAAEETVDQEQALEAGREEDGQEESGGRAESDSESEAQEQGERAEVDANGEGSGDEGERAAEGAEPAAEGASPGEGAAPEEHEWPAEESLEPPEPLEGLEGEGIEPSPVD